MRQVILLTALLTAAPTVEAGTFRESTSFDAQNTSAPFLARGVGPRAVGMGEAFVAVADDPSAVSWNPGGIGQIQSLGVMAMYDIVGEGLSETYLAGVMPVGPGVAGLGLTLLQYGSIALRDDVGTLTGTETPMDLCFTGTFAIANPAWLGGKGWTGLGVEVIRDTSSAMLLGVNLGTVVPVSPRLSAGAALLHVGAGAEGFSLPMSFHAGASYLPMEMVLVATDIGYGISDALVTAALGVEVTPIETAVLRIGYKFMPDQGFAGLSGVTAGFGVRFAGFGLDYSYQPFGELATSHRIALVYSGGVTGKRRDSRISIATEYSAANDMYNQRNYDGAIQKATAVVEAYPSHWQAWQLLGNSRYAKGDRAGAVTAYRRSLAANPANPGLKAWADKLAAQTNASKPAAQSGTDAAYRDANALYTGRDYDGAWRKAYAILQTNPNHWQAWQLVGNCQYAKGDRAGALVSYRRSLSINPNNPGLQSWVKKVEGQ